MACKTPESLCAIVERWNPGRLSPGCNALREARGSISLTCFQWRATVLREPALWSTIVSSSREGRRFPNPSLIPLELQRAGSRLLAWSHEGYDPDEDALGAILKTSIERCESIRVHPRQNNKARTLLLFHHAPQPPLSFSNLQSLCLTEYARGRDTCIFDLRSMPVLRGLSIHFVDAHPRLVIHLPPTCNITRLYLDGAIDPPSAVNLINLCHLLDTLWWNDYASSPPQILPPLLPLHHLRCLSITGALPILMFLRVLAPNVEHLEIDTLNDSWARKLLPTLHFPRLRVASIQTAQLRFGPSDLPCNILVNFLQRHSSELEMIQIPQYLSSNVVRSLGACIADLPHTAARNGLFRFNKLRAVYISRR